MNEIKQKDELLRAVKAPKKKKSPSNRSLYIALFAADFIFGVLDIGSGITVYWMTGIWFYGLLVFLAGFAPLLLFQSLFTRAFASDEQKKVAIGGAVLAVFSIISIGILSVIANVQGVDSKFAEQTVLIVIVVLAFIHALLFTGYFYIDEGIQADQVVIQTIARAMRESDMIEAGGQVLETTQRSLNRRHEIGDKYSSRAALMEVLSQFGFKDLDEDGIPDFMDKTDNRTGQPFKKQVYASEVRQENPTKPPQQ
jgi:hypothetical protein